MYPCQILFSSHSDAYASLTHRFHLLKFPNARAMLQAGRPSHSPSTRAIIPRNLRQEQVFSLWSRERPQSIILPYLPSEILINHEIQAAGFPAFFRSVGLVWMVWGLQGYWNRGVCREGECAKFGEWDARENGFLLGSTVPSECEIGGSDCEELWSMGMIKKKRRRQG